MTQANEHVFHVPYGSVVIGDDGHEYTQPGGDPVPFSHYVIDDPVIDSLADFKPLGWYSMYGLSIETTKWEDFLAVIGYYRLRWWLGWGKAYRACEEEWDFDD